MTKPIQTNAYTVTSFKIAKPKPRKRRTRDVTMWANVWFLENGEPDHAEFYVNKKDCDGYSGGTTCRVIVKGVPVRK